MGGVGGRKFHGLKFRRQHAVAPFVVDFACLEQSLVIEIDGKYHEFVEEADKQRQQFIEECGFRVLRFTNEDVLSDVEAVLIAIERLSGLGPSP